MSDQPTMRDTLAGDRAAVIAQVNAELAQHLPYWPTAVVTHVVDAMTTIGWRKVPDRDAAVKMVWDALGALPGVPMFPGELADAAEAAVDALFGELAAGEAAS